MKEQLVTKVYPIEKEDIQKILKYDTYCPFGRELKSTLEGRLGLLEVYYTERKEGIEFKVEPSRDTPELMKRISEVIGKIIETSDTLVEYGHI